MAKTIYRREYRALLELLLAERAESGLTQGELAEALGHAQSTLSHIERGSRRLDVIELIDYCKAIGADPRKVFDKLLVATGTSVHAKKRGRRSNR